MVFCEGIDRAADWQVGSDGRPSLPTVFRAKQIGLEISVLVVVEGGIQTTLLVLARPDPLDVSLFRNALETICRGPLVRIGRLDTEQSIVGSCIQKAFDQR